MKRAGVVLFFIAASLCYAQIEIQKVVVEDEALQESKELRSDEIEFTRQQDLAQVLSETRPEINMVRASAIGNDIVLRGFKRDDINVLIDGAKIYGGCPNRMDPPAMHISVADIAKVQIKEGPFDVEDFGSMGGVINVITKEPQSGFGGTLGLTYGSFAYNKEELSLHAGDEKFRFALGIGHENSDQYQDGDGRTLVEQNWAVLGKNDPYAYQERYKDLDAYTRNVFWAKTIYDIASNQTLKLNFYTDKATNVLYPAFQMDAQLDETLMFNGEYEIRDFGKYSKSLVLKGYYSRVLHDMGTEFRNAALNPMLYRTHHVRSEIKGATLKNSFDAFGIVWKAGINTSERNWNGICLAEPSKKPKQVRIPDVDTNNVGFFVEGGRRLGDWSFKAGARYDTTDITANGLRHPTIAHIAPIQNYYKGKTSKSYNDISANLLAKYRLSEQNVLYIGLGQGVRVPDAQELYFIGFMMGNWSRRGNPDLKESKNRELDMGFEGVVWADTSLRFNLFYSDLKDYIYAYRTNQGNKDPQKYYLTWTNIDAHIYGGSVDLAKPFGDFWLAEASASYQRGKKDDTIPGQVDDDMAMVPPLHARVALSYEDEEYYAMIEALYSAPWDHYDADNGERRIDSWAVVNIKASKQISDTIRINVGVDNLFDETYVLNNTYVGRSLIGGRTPVLINEPGRYLYANVQIRF